MCANVTKGENTIGNPQRTERIGCKLCCQLSHSGFPIMTASELNFLDAAHNRMPAGILSGSLVCLDATSI
ncbi:hypothetical protein J1614_005917 [Plenodomus biglobosus]|nr:hypothetical protein J1614_005917 [Plenodomus biglobosus]